jgi:K(+)-stimulated pyrophosphate-energized sodium pump
VGDVAGMGADLYESFVATVLGCMILGLAVEAPADLKIKLCLLPLALGAGGVIASILGMSLVRVGKNGSPQAALNKGTFAAAALSALFSWPIFHFTLGGETFGPAANPAGAGNLFWAIVIGVVGGTAIGLLTEYYTGTGRRPVNSIVPPGSARHLGQDSECFKPERACLAGTRASPKAPRLGVPSAT